MLSVVPTLTLPERGDTMGLHTNPNSDRRLEAATNLRKKHERFNVDRELYHAVMTVNGVKLPVEVLVTKHHTGKDEDRTLVTTSTRILPEDLKQGMKQYVASRNLSLDEVKKDANLTRIRLQKDKTATNRDFATFDGGPILRGDRGNGWEMIPFSRLSDSDFLEEFAYFQVYADMTHIYRQEEVTVTSDNGPICTMRSRTIDAARRAFWKNFLELNPGCDWTSKTGTELMNVLKANFSK